MQDVNAYVLLCIENDSVYRKTYGQNSNGQALNSETIFEGASLSKTVFAYLFWLLRKDFPELRRPLHLKDCDSHSVYLNPLYFLRHAVSSTDSCVINSESDSFKYSENNYLLLQKYVEKICGKSLEELAFAYVFKPLMMNNSSFIWQPKFDNNYVNGYFENHKMHRSIRKSKVAQSNGTLFTCAKDIAIFAKALLKSDVSDSIFTHEIKVHNYKHLSWGNGMGIDRSTKPPLLWQWGCNWSYNHIMLIEKQNKLIFIGLTNSIIGAKRLRNTCNTLFDSNLELFNYINWY